MLAAAARRWGFAAALGALGALGVAAGGAAADDDPKPAPSGGAGEEAGKGEERKPAPCADCRDGKECAKCEAARRLAEEKAKRPAAAAFRLKDTNGREHALADYRGKVVVLEWTNHGCPFVKKHYDSGNMQDLQGRYAKKGVIWLTICSSAEGKQGHMSAREWNEKVAALKAAATAVLLDADGAAGKAYGATTTPHMFVVDAEGRVAYRGALDDDPSSKASDAKRARNFVAEAVDAVLEDRSPPVADTKPYG
jgi:peroxiredoxin